jgi:hypothetical protein
MDYHNSKSTLCINETYPSDYWLRVTSDKSLRKNNRENICMVILKNGDNCMRKCRGKYCTRHSYLGK